jgi:hypothetical protein
MNQLKATAILFLVAAAPFVSAGQQIYSPPPPLYPTTMAQCDKFQSDYAKFENQISAQHESCLTSHTSNKAKKTTEPSDTCSVPACQSLHTRLSSVRSVGSSEVSACRQKVQQLLDDAMRKKQGQDAAARRAEEERKEAEDSKRRKEYGDQQERSQAARDAAARKQAEIEEVGRKKHDELLESQKRERDAAAAKARAEEEARDRREGLESEKHILWKAREDKRKAQIEQLEDAAANIPDEQQRHAALEQAMKEIRVIKEQSKQDPEPR